MGERRASQVQTLGFTLLVAFVAGVVGARLTVSTPPAHAGGDADAHAQLEQLGEQVQASQQQLSQLEAQVAAAQGVAAVASTVAPAPDTSGLTAELTAAIADQEGQALVKTYRGLLERGLDPSQLNEDGLPPLVLASERGRLELCRALLERVDPDQRGQRWGETALVAAATAGNKELVQLLLDAGGDPTVICGPCDGPEAFVTALSQARDNDRQELVPLLKDVVGHWPGRRRILAIVRYVIAAPGPGLTDEPLQVDLGLPEGRWGHLHLDLRAGKQTEILDPFVLPASLGEQIFELSLRWRLGDEHGEMPVFVNKLNADEKHVTSVIEVGSYPRNARVELLIQPVNFF